LNKEYIKNGFTNTDKSIFVAEVDTKRMKIGKDYSKETVLSAYVHKQYSEILQKVRSPEFKRFIHPHVKHGKIIKFMADMIEKLPQ
jgi:hypothetical protein